MNKVTIYTTPFCGYCMAAKHLLDSLHIPYDSIDISQDDTLREKLSGAYHWSTVPMIVIGEEFIGGYEELARLSESGALQKKLSMDIP